jgi:hypothetical protein
MNMLIQHGHGDAAWKWRCSMEMKVQHGNGGAVWTWSCYMVRDMRHGHEHPAWEMDIQHGRWTCSIDEGI